jgi:hypothetical protein
VELNALLLHNSNTILILILEYQRDLISLQRQCSDTTFVKQAVKPVFKTYGVEKVIRNNISKLLL